MRLNFPLKPPLHSLKPERKKSSSSQAPFIAREIEVGSEREMTSKLRVLTHCLFFFLFITHLCNGLSSGHQALLNESKVMKPVAVPGQGSLVLNKIRRRLGSFQICALCTCCGGRKGLCLPSPCCYAINCNIPNRPFGFCSFTPKACNCFGCHY